MAATATALAMAVAISGCTPRTEAGLEKRPPTIEAPSPHSVTELTACISDKLKRYSESTTNYVPTPDGGTLTYVFLGRPTMSVHIADHGGTRQVTTFGPYFFDGKVKRHRLDAVRQCL